MPIHLLDHPLAGHALAALRDRRTGPDAFRRQCERLTLLLAAEATRDLPTVETLVETPLAPAPARMLAAPVVAVPILRAGLGMLPPLLHLFPEIAVGYVGLERDERTAVARAYYQKLPPLEGRAVLLLDPMLATGGSADQALTALAEAGAQDVRLLCIVAAPEGVDRVSRRHPRVTIFTAAVDRELNAQKYIVPGLGDFGDRLYGTEGGGRQSIDHG
jgi:uracil phosphoribosyltransferase